MGVKGPIAQEHMLAETTIASVYSYDSISGATSLTSNLNVMVLKL